MAQEGIERGYAPYLANLEKAIWGQALHCTLCLPMAFVAQRFIRLLFHEIKLPWCLSLPLAWLELTSISAMRAR